MNFSCIFLLALALFGTATQAYIGGGGLGYGGVGPMGYNGVCETSCGAHYGGGYGGGYEAGFGCRTTCSPGCGTACTSAAVSDNCQCMKTVVRPSMIERIPYSCSRRIHSTACRSGCGIYPGAGYGGIGGGVGGGCSGYMNDGYLY